MEFTPVEKLVVAITSFAIMFLMLGVLMSFDSTSKAYSTDDLGEVIRRLSIINMRVERIEKEQKIVIPDDEKLTFYRDGKPV